MNGVGQTTGQKKITPKMIDRQRLIAKTEITRLHLMVGLFVPAGQTPEGVTKKSKLDTIQGAEPAAHPGSLESTSPQIPDKGSMDVAQRTTLHHELRILLDDQDQTSGEMAGGSPTKYPRIFLTPNPNDTPTQSRSRVPGLSRLLALVGLRVERGRAHDDGCFFCGR